MRLLFLLHFKWLNKLKDISWKLFSKIILGSFKKTTIKVIRAVPMKITGFFNVLLRSLVNIFRHFWGEFCVLINLHIPEQDNIR